MNLLMELMFIIVVCLLIIPIIIGCTIAVLLGFTGFYFYLFIFLFIFLIWGAAFVFFYD